MAQHNTLNLLEFIVDGEEDRHQATNGYSPNGSSNKISKEYYDTERQAIIGATTARSFTEFEMKKVCFDLNAKVKKCDPNAGFRGKKLLVQRSRSGASDQAAKTYSEFQRPFSAGYNRKNSICSSTNNTKRRAKSARIPRRRPFSASEGQSSRTVESSNGEDQQKITESEWEELFPEDIDEEDSLNEENTRQQQQQSQPTSLLSRKKQLKLKVFKMDPEMFYDGKLEKKYGELEELMGCDFDKQKRKMIEQHLEQMNRIDDRYRNLSNGRPSSAVVIPRSLSNPNKQKKPRPNTASRSMQKLAPTKHEYRNIAAGPSESMTETDQKPTMPKTKYGVYIDRSPLKQNDCQETKSNSSVGGQPSKEEIGKQNSTNKEDNEEGKCDLQETRDSWGAMKVDHHIKNSDNDYLKKWLKEKDKMHRRKIREEKRKKKEERDKLIQEANEKLERKILSYRAVDEWMKEKNKEMGYRMKEQIKKENEVIENYRNSLLLPQQSLLIKSIDKDDNGLSQRQNRHEKLYIQKGGNCERKDGNRQGFAGSTTKRPPQARFMYKRPATAGNIKFNLEARGRSPVPPLQRSELNQFELNKNKVSNKQKSRDQSSRDNRRNSNDYEEVHSPEQPNTTSSVHEYLALFRFQRAPPPELSAESPRQANTLQRPLNMTQTSTQSYPFQNMFSEQNHMNQAVSEARRTIVSTHEVVEELKHTDQRGAKLSNVHEEELSDNEEEGIVNSNLPEILDESDEEFFDDTLDVWDSSMTESDIQEEKRINALNGEDESSKLVSENEDIIQDQRLNDDQVHLDTKKDKARHAAETDEDKGTGTGQCNEEFDEENAAKQFVRLSCVEDVELLMEDSQSNRKPL